MSQGFEREVRITPRKIRQDRTEGARRRRNSILRRTDDQIDAMEAEAKALMAKKNPSVKVNAAKEGMTFEL